MNLRGVAEAILCVFVGVCVGAALALAMPALWHVIAAHVSVTWK